MTDFTEGLNSFQREAVTYGEGPMLILAGAGSGKTRVMTHRIAWLMQERRVPAFRILAVTFTNKAARELRERVEKLAGEEGKEVWAMTFHSLCVRILRRHIDRLSGYTRSFVIYDAADQNTLVKDCLKELDIDPKLYQPKAIRAAIGKIKDDMLSPEEYIDSAGVDIRKRTVGKIFQLYQKKLQASNALDFDDIILKTLELFVLCPDVLDEYRKRFLYVLVDEYQDTNEAQFQLVRLLSSRYRNICVVGDDDQSIYAFRGAKIKNILDFEKEFPGAHRIKLEENYRSTENILNAANSVIANNTRRKDKRLYTGRKGGSKVHLAELSDERREADYICKNIKKRIGEGRKPSDFAILYRTNAISRVIEEALLSAEIPYSVYGGLRFYDRAEIKDIVAYLRIIVNPADDVSFRRVVNVPRRGIGDKTIEELATLASSAGVSLMSAISSAEAGGLKQAAVSKLKAFCDDIDALRKATADMGLGDAVSYVIDKSGYSEMLKLANTVEDKTRLENLDELVSAASQFSSDNEGSGIGDFLEGITLVSDIDKMDDENGTVALMTVHSAKGLEFPVVFIAAMEEGIFPHQLSIDEDEEAVEEERRLCYVAITRAEDELFITHTNMRSTHARSEAKLPSRFLDELDMSCCDEDSTGSSRGIIGDSLWNRSPGYSRAVFDDYIPDDAESYSSFKPKKKQTPCYEDVFEEKQPPKAPEKTENSGITLGTRVQHKRFGIGTVVNIEEAGGEKLLVVAFEKGGIKKLLADITPLKILS